MDINISWYTIIKLMVGGLGTYVVLPAFLVLRDILLWSLIERYLLNDDLHAAITDYADGYATMKYKYNNSYSVPDQDGRSFFYINNKEVPFSEYYQHLDAIENINHRIESADSLIKIRSKRLDYLLKYYKQDVTNPIDKWRSNAVKSAEERAQTDMIVSTLEAESND